MPVKKATKKKTAKVVTPKWIAVTSKSYGNALKGIKVYYEGERPKNLKDDGSFQFGKNIIEALQRKFSGKFKLILTKNTDSISKKASIFEVRISTKILTSMNQEKFDRSRDVKNDIIQRKFSIIFPSYFNANTTIPYIPGTLAKILGSGVSKKMTTKDKDALNAFLPEYLGTEAQSAIILKASTQIKSLQDLADELKSEIKSTHSENWWQTYVKDKILLIQQGYIKSIEKINTAVGKTKFPDFSLVTHDNYIDIMEIKKPNTPMMKYDAGRDNYHWDSEMAKAIIQLENYLENVSNNADSIRSYIKDKYKIDLKIVRPRGIILAGNSAEFSEQKQKDDFRLLSQGLKHINVLTYDELHIRLENYISVLKQFSKKSNPVKKVTKKKK